MPTEHDDTAPPSKDDILAAHVASGLSLKKAAKKAGVGERTGQRRMADPEFRSRVDGLRRVIIGEAVGKLSVSMAAAAAKLAKLVKSGDERIALAAAKEVVALGLKARRDEDLEWQIADLTTRFEVIVASKVKGTTRAR
jgi:hypothetical protein